MPDQQLYDDNGKPIGPATPGAGAAATLYDDDGKPLAPPAGPDAFAQAHPYLQKAHDLAVKGVKFAGDVSLVGGDNVMAAGRAVKNWALNPANRPAQGAMAGGMAGAEVGALGGPVGAGVGAVLGAAAGGFGGAKVRGDTTHDAAIEGLKEGAFQAPFAMLPGVGKVAEEFGLDLIGKANKPTIAAIKKTNTFRGGGTVPEAEREITQTLAEVGAGRPSAASARKVQDALNAADAELAHAIATSKGVVQKQDIAAALAKTYNDIAPGSVAGDHARQGILTSFQSLMQAPDQIPVQLAQRIKQDIYAAGNYARDAKDAGVAAAEKVKGRALRENIAAAEPAAATANDRISRLIPASKTAGEGAFRAGKRDAFSLPELVTGAGALASGNPKALAATGAAIFNRPGMMGGTGQLLYNAAQPAKKAAPAVLTPQAIRALVMSMLQGGDQQPQP